MVAFASARTRSLLSMIWSVKVPSITNETVELDKSKQFIENQQTQNKCFLEASKNGGMWFS